MKLSSKELYRLFNDNNAVDAPWYREQYRDVALSGIDPIHHYVRYGWLMGRKPSRAFDPERYRTHFPEDDFSDVNPLAHYLAYRQSSDLPLGLEANTDYTLSFYGERALESVKAAYRSGDANVVAQVSELVERAREALGRGPYSVTDKTTMPPSGILNDYWHPAPYAWPNPDTPDGLPYVHRDGERVHGTVLYEKASEKYDRTSIQRLFDETTLHALAWYFTGEEPFIVKAHQLVRVWFVDEQTRMNPHLRYSQVFMGKNNNQGKPTGLIETKDFYFFLDAVRLIKRTKHWSRHDDQCFKQWCEQFLEWLLTSPQGRRECAATNNHGIAYDLQVYAFQAYLNDAPGMRLTLERALGRMGEHFDQTGYQHREMERTTTAHYTAFNIQLWLNFLFLVQNTLNYSLLDYTVDYGSEKANPVLLGLKWLLPYYGKEWPHPQIDEFDSWRLPTLYHCAAVFAPRYLAAYAEHYPPVYECKAYHYPHDGVAPFWLLNAMTVTDYPSLENHKATPYSIHDIKQKLLKHLWGGLSQPALVALEAIAENPHYDCDRRVMAGWELSRWFTFRNDDKRAYEYLNGLFRIDEKQARVKEVVLAKAYCEMRLGMRDLAIETLSAFVEDAGEDPDALLALATTCQDDDDKLAYINRMYQQANCCPIRKKDENRPLSIENVAGGHCPPAENVEHKVSIIMPVYNAEDKLPAAVDSLLAQTWRNLEIIIVDDCSQDATYDIAKRYAEQDQRVVALRQPQNGGAYKARNSGLEHVTGDFITTHDSDDWSHPQKIERQMGHLLADETLMGVSACWVRTQSDLSFTQNWRPARTLIHKSESSFLFRRAVYDTLGPWQDVRVGGDNEFIGRMKAHYGAKSYRVVDTHVPLAFGLDDESSLTRAKATHVSTVYSGLRHVYRELWRWLHLNHHPREAASPDVLPMPDKMVRRSNEVIELDWVVVADFCDASMVESLLDAKSKEKLFDRTVGLFHWPRFDSRPGNFCEEYFQCLKELNAVPLVFGDSVRAQHVAIACKTVVQHAVDARPDIEVGDSVVVVGELPESLLKGSSSLFGKPIRHVARLEF